MTERDRREQKRMRGKGKEGKGRKEGTIEGGSGIKIGQHIQHIRKEEEL